MSLVYKIDRSEFKKVKVRGVPRNAHPKNHELERECGFAISVGRISFHHNAFHHDTSGKPSITGSYFEEIFS